MQMNATFAVISDEESGSPILSILDRLHCSELFDRVLSREDYSNFRHYCKRPKFYAAELNNLTKKVKTN